VKEATADSTRVFRGVTRVRDVGIRDVTNGQSRWVPALAPSSEEYRGFAGMTVG